MKQSVCQPAKRSIPDYLRLLLFPFSLLYGLIVSLRNLFFDFGWKPSQSFEIPVISIGNLTVGGTGKTPHAEYLIRLLQPAYKVALVSRGYRRKTRGVVIANTSSTALEIGDEPKQIFDKFSQLSVIAAEKRVDGIRAALLLPTQPEVVLLDDAFQHRYVKPGLSILLMDYNRPLWRDCMLPAGNLREPVKGKERAQIIIVTKCPQNLSQTEANAIAGKLKLSLTQHLFFTTFAYGQPIPLLTGNEHSFPSSGAALAVTGIARPQPFYQQITNNGFQLSIQEFPDHHQFTSADLQQIETTFLKMAQDNKVIVTTEKDAVRLREMNQLTATIVHNSWIIPIEVAFLFNQKELFNHQIMQYVRKD